MSRLPARAWLLLALVLASGALVYLVAFPPWGLRRLDPSRRYAIELGRGSGRFGLDTVKVSSGGTATVCRWSKEKDRWETADLPLSPDQLDEVLAAVEQSRLLALR